MKTTLTAIGICIGGTVLLVLIGALIGLLSPGFGATFISFSPVAAIGATVSYVRDQREKKRKANESLPG